MIAAPWDYLVVTAANDLQAAAYRDQLDWRRRLGFLSQVKEVLTIADPGGKRVGSGGSTIHCLLSILNGELKQHGGRSARPHAWLEVFRSLRVLIVHAGGDSRRLPAYSPCGKIFVPVPGESDRALSPTLLDRQLPVYLGLPPGANGRGQVVIATGDVLLAFDPDRVDFTRPGITGLGCPASPDTAKDHGVFCADNGGRVRRFLQKPTPAEQSERQVLNRHGDAILDVGVMSFDAEAAVRLVSLVEPSVSGGGELGWQGPLAATIEAKGLDFYREICCALGAETTAAEYAGAVERSGSTLGGAELEKLFAGLAGLPFSLCLLSRCGFLHFGTTRQLISSGNDLLSMDHGISHHRSCLSINNDLGEGGAISGGNAWVEGCRIDALLQLGGENAVVGVDVLEPLVIRERGVLDIVAGKDRRGGAVWFVRCYLTDDVLHKPAAAGGSLAGLLLPEWLKAIGAGETDVWAADVPPGDRSVWNGRFFPAVASSQDYRRWLWMLDPRGTGEQDRQAWRTADRYSLAEILRLSDLEVFHNRRLLHRGEEMRRSLPRIFRLESEFSARELAVLWQHMEAARRRQWLLTAVREIHRQWASTPAAEDLESLEISRVLHTIGTAISLLEQAEAGAGADLLQHLHRQLTDRESQWLGAFGLQEAAAGDPGAWVETAHQASFAHLSRVIVFGAERENGHPKNALRSDEIAWGRAPVRLDLGGGWTDTPPYALEHGGCVINAAVDLNGQPPIHAYARVIPEPELRLASIDQGERKVITELADLLDYRAPSCEFGIAKAALALSGFSPQHASWPSGATTLAEMLRLFGGGIEITTLAAIPSGSGLGTSSIMGAVLLALVARLTGRELMRRDLFNRVLQLEQELTTGGGWQDQIGGVVPGVKMITTEPGLVPDPRLHFVPADLLDPRANGGQTLLYYTGRRRLARNILQTVVGNYLDRDRAGMETLRQLRAFPPQMTAAMAAKDMEGFGRLLDRAWNLNKAIDPGSTTAEIDGILEKIAPHTYGAKLLGAGGGGFLLIVARSQDDALAVRRRLAAEPPNPRARFFDYAITGEGLVVTVC